MVEEVRLGNLLIADAVVEHVKAKWSYAPLQNPRKIAEALRLVTDKDVWREAAAQIEQWNHGATDLDASKLKSKLASIAERRNQIAHYADLEDNQLHTRRAIDAGAVRDVTDWIERIALAIAVTLG